MHHPLSLLLLLLPWRTALPLPAAESGEVWAFGSHQSGQLGVGSTGQAKHATPRLLRALQGAKITEVGDGAGAHPSAGSTGLLHTCLLQHSTLLMHNNSAALDSALDSSRCRYSPAATTRVLPSTAQHATQLRAVNMRTVHPGQRNLRQAPSSQHCFLSAGGRRLAALASPSLQWRGLRLGRCHLWCARHRPCGPPRAASAHPGQAPGLIQRAVHRCGSLPLWLR